MGIRKTLLLLSAVTALVALAAPAMVQAHYVWTEEGPIHLEGQLESNITGSAVETECEVTFEGTATNTGPEGSAHGAIEGGKVGHCVVRPFPQDLCDIKSVTFGALPWTITTSTSHPEVTIDGATFTNHYTEKCKNFGLPTTISSTGAATGTISSSRCISFTKAGDLKVEAPEALKGAAIQLNGEVCLTEGGPELE